MKIIISPLAKRDLIEIGDWIAHDNPPRAASFVAEIITEFEHICDFPFAYPEIPYENRQVRQKMYRRYRILYECLPDRVRIVTIRHSARRK